MLISSSYRQQQALMHATHDGYGVASLRWASQVAVEMTRCGALEVLDYGAGKERLAQALRTLAPQVKVRAYEPAMPHLSASPEPCEFVACIDVLEHVEPELLPNVLDDLERVTVACGFFTVAFGPAVKCLPDGRNAHLIQQPAAWWMPLLRARWRVATVHATSRGMACALRAL